MERIHAVVEGLADVDGPILIGADLGTVTTSLALAPWRGDAELGVASTVSVRHCGQPLDLLLEAYAALGPERVAGIVACGVHGDRLGAPAVAGLPEEVALEQAAARLLPWDGAAAVVRIGGGGFAVLARSAEGGWTYEKNDRCSAGTGQAAERLCDRFGCTLEEAVGLALESPGGVALTARCAVFAKSELTHFANQGEDHGRLFRGYFEALAENILALTARVGEKAPLLLVGNGALITPLAETLAHSARAPVATAVEAGAFDALGALWYGARHGAAGAGPWPDDPRELVGERTAHIRPQGAAGAGPGAVVSVPEAAWIGAGAPGEEARAGAVLGLDLGSTGSKASLLDRASGARPGQRVPADGRQPGRGRAGAGRQGGRDERSVGRRRRYHRLRPRRGGGGLPGGVPRERRRTAAGPERDRGPRDRRGAPGPRWRPQPLDRRDRRSGRQVHQRPRRPGGRLAT